MMVVDKIFALNHDCFCHRMYGLVECAFQQNSRLYSYRDFCKKEETKKSLSSTYI